LQGRLVSSCLSLFPELSLLARPGLRTAPRVSFLVSPSGAFLGTLAIVFRYASVYWIVLYPRTSLFEHPIFSSSCQHLCHLELQIFPPFATCLSPRLTRGELWRISVGPVVLQPFFYAFFGILSLWSVRWNRPFKTPFGCTGTTCVCTQKNKKKSD